jgi:hypothetical protein
MGIEREPVVVYTAQGGTEEEQVCAFLGAHGIPTTTRGEALRHTHAFVLDGLGAVEILVAAEHAAEARRLMEGVERGEFILDEDWENPEGS